MAQRARLSKTIMQDEVFQNAFEHAAIGMILSDIHGRCLRANHAFCEMVGYTEAQLQQWEFGNLTHPDDLAQNLVLGRRLLTGELPSIKFEKRYRHKLGHYVWGLLSASMMRDPAGEPLFIISQVQDISEQKKAEEALHRSEASQRALLGALPDAMFQLSAEGIILRIHPPRGQQLFLPENQLLGQHFHALAPPDVRVQLDQALIDARATGVPVVLELPFRVREQTEYYEVRVSAIEDDGLLLIVRKISDRVRAEQAEREQRLLAEALHDTAATLSGMLNADELLDQLLVNAQRVVPHDLATLMLIDQTRTARLVRSYGQAADTLSTQLSAVRFPLSTTANLRRMTDTGQPVIIADVYESPGWVVLPGMDWTRAYLGAPIVIKGETIGFIGLYTRAANSFTQDHAERLEAFTRQAAMALENARLFEAEREQSDLAEALRDTASALNRTLDIDEVLDRILSNTARVVTYDAINIMLLDDARQTVSVVRQLGYAHRGQENWIKQLRLPVATTPNLQQMMTTGQPHLVGDTHTQAGWVEFAETRWLRAYVGVPFQNDGQVVGFLNLDSATPHFFTPDHVGRLRAFADQIATAVRNARLYAASRRNVQRLTALYEASLDLAQANSPARLYQQLLRAVVGLLEAKASALTLFDGEQHLIITAVENLSQNLVSERLPVGRGLNGQAALSRQIQQVADYTRFENRLPVMADLRQVAVVAVPLLWQDRLVGTIWISDQRPRVFDEDDLHMLTLFATLAAAAIEQGRALNEAQVRETEARLLSARLTSAQEDERSRIAAFLHDAVGGQLVMLQKNTEQLQVSFASSEATLHLLSNNLNLLQQAHQQVRSLATDLDSKVLTDLGLVPAIRQHVERLCTSASLPIQLHITGHVRRLSAEIERVVFRSLQEALANVLRHAQATDISAQLHMGGRTLRLTVQDNGQGFDAAAQTPGTELGLPQIRRQVEALRGEFFLETTPGFGTLMAMQIPISTGAADHARAGVLIVDDHELLRQGLRQLIAETDDFVCVGEAVDTTDALRQFELTRPNLVVMDVKLPGGSGIEATRQILRRYPDSRIIIYTYHADETYLEQAMHAGAKGYLLKSDHGRLILTALRAVLANEVFIAPSLTDTWAKLQLRPTSVEPVNLLSPREREVLQAVALGKANLDIAAELGISARTVEVHRRNILDKLGYRNVAQLVKFAMDHNLI
ncbi:MAG: GAF domain-containing protein [Thermoflexales bacterium]|nr:GAF domain-containing protein [Thermoflexales bacterium]